ncbi:MAG TPA: MFS transporter [Phototrophicaceae bacterium]|nr:MFS transporter [Phototrophicaceae bacterium]
MERKQLTALAVCNLGLYTGWIMALILLPVYAQRLGMDAGATGVYLGLAFTAITIGALSSGWFSDRFQRRKRTILVVSVISIPLTYLIGQVSSIPLLIACTLLTWFATGIATTMINILTGMYAEPRQRGRVFGVIATTSSLAQVIGGFAAGAIVDRWGFSGLFSAISLIWLVAIGAALFLDDSKRSAGQHEQRASAIPLGKAIWLLLLANTLMWITSFGSGLVRPLMMNGLGFDASAISSVTTVSGLVSLPLPFVVGWLSDRIGRRLLLIVSYGLASLGMLLLIAALGLWQFWLSASMFTLAGGMAGVANAFVTDLAAPQALSRALASFAATPWIAGIIGYAVTGLIIQSLGLPETLLISAALPVFSIPAILRIRRDRQMAAA